MVINVGLTQSTGNRSASPDGTRYDVHLKNADDLGPIFSDRGVVFHGINKSGSLVMADVMREAYIHADRAGQFISHYHKEPADYEKMLALVERPANGHEFFVGHYLYNVVNHSDNKLWITQLRHPVPRIVSCYQWIKNKHKKTTGSFEGFPSLTEFVIATRGKRQSQMLHFAPEGFLGDAGKRMSNDALRDGAIEALDSRVRWFGIAEYFEESIFALAHLCNLPSVIAWKKDTRNTDRALVSDLPADEVELIEHTFAHDIATYEYAKSLFLKKISKVEFGDDFAAYKKRCAGEYKDRIL